MLESLWWGARLRRKCGEIFEMASELVDFISSGNTFTFMKFMGIGYERLS
jgi:hypothetical protein